jgi:hypothetical protein
VSGTEQFFFEGEWKFGGGVGGDGVGQDNSCVNMELGFLKVISINTFCSLCDFPNLIGVLTSLLLTYT